MNTMYLFNRALANAGPLNDQQRKAIFAKGGGGRPGGGGGGSVARDQKTGGSGVRFIGWAGQGEANGLPSEDFIRQAERLGYGRSNFLPGWEDTPLGKRLKSLIGPVAGTTPQRGGSGDNFGVPPPGSVTPQPGMSLKPTVPGMMYPAVQPPAGTHWEYDPNGGRQPVRDGMVTPGVQPRDPGQMYIGGNPDFDERTGRYRDQAEPVYTVQNPGFAPGSQGGTVHPDQNTPEYKAWFQQRQEWERSQPGAMPIGGPAPVRGGPNAPIVATNPKNGSVTGGRVAVRPELPGTNPPPVRGLPIKEGPITTPKPYKPGVPPVPTKPPNQIGGGGGIPTIGQPRVYRDVVTPGQPLTRSPGGDVQYQPGNSGQGFGVHAYDPTTGMTYMSQNATSYGYSRPDLYRPATYVTASGQRAVAATPYKPANPSRIKTVYDPAIRDVRPITRTPIASTPLQPRKPAVSPGPSRPLKPGEFWM